MQFVARTLHRQLLPPLSVFVLAFLALVAVPFFLYGLHLQPDNLILGGAFDPKDRMPYLFLPVYYVSTFAAAGGPYAAGLVTVIAPVTLALSWRTFSRRGRYLSFALWAVSAATLALMLTPLGRNILIWYFD